MAPTGPAVGVKTARKERELTSVPWEVEQSTAVRMLAKQREEASVPATETRRPAVHHPRTVCAVGDHYKHTSDRVHTGERARALYIQLHVLDTKVTSSKIPSSEITSIISSGRGATCPKCAAQWIGVQP